MILQFLFAVLIALLNGLSSFLPPVTELPFVDTYLTSGFGYVRFIATVIPPVATMLIVFTTYIGFVIVLKVIAMIPILKGFLASL